jgi:outer membrane protein assembly factor BamB
MRSAFGLFTLVLLSPLASAENWPQWRGPKNDGISSEKGLPSKWSETENIVWKVKMPGPGASTPCIWGDNIFLTAVEGTDLVLFCVGTDGKDRWKKVIGSGNKAARGDEGNSASASCSTDGKLVFALVGDGSLVAYDFSGNEKWKVDTQAKYGKFEIQFGGHWTPVLFQDVLYVALMHRKAQVLIAFKAATGEEIWKVNRKSDGKGESPDVYSSPFIWQKGNDALLIAHGNDYCTAHSLKDGSEVWRVTELNPKAKYNMAWRAVSSPLVTPDLIVVPSCKSGVTVGIDPSKAKGEIEPGNSAQVWRHEKNTPDVPSPLLVDGIVYIFRETSNLMTYDAKTGAAIYTEKITNERHRANPVYGDGKVYLVGREGNMAVVKAGKEFDLLSKTKLPDTFTASPAVSGGRIYLRGWNSLWAIGEKK